MNASVHRDKSLRAPVKRERLVRGNSPGAFSPASEALGGTTAPFSLAATGNAMQNSTP